MQHVTRVTPLLAVLAVVLLLASFTSSVGADKSKRQTRALVEVENPEEVLELLSRLMHGILRATAYDTQEKRNIDLGFSRGFSGGQAAKHLMGLAAANFAGGPGRRRRSLDQDQDQD